MNMTVYYKKFLSFQLHLIRVIKFKLPRKNSCSKEQEFFSYIRLRRVILLRSYIRLMPSDIALRAVKGEYNITETEGFNITFTK